MKSRVIVIAAPLLALMAAVAVRQTLGKRRPTASQPEVSATSASSQDVAPAATDVASPPVPNRARLPKSVQTPASPPARAIDEAIETSYASTIAAFALFGEEADYATHDATAQRDADRLQELFVSVRGELSDDLAKDCEAIVDRIAAAQLQLMAFAINRKNRGLPDSAQAETELADRKAFQEDAAPLFERIKATLSVAAGAPKST